MKKRMSPTGSFLPGPIRNPATITDRGGAQGRQDRFEPREADALGTETSPFAAPLAKEPGLSSVTRGTTASVASDGCTCNIHKTRRTNHLASCKLARKRHDTLRLKEAVLDALMMRDAIIDLDPFQDHPLCRLENVQRNINFALSYGDRKDDQ